MWWAERRGQEWRSRSTTLFVDRAGQPHHLVTTADEVTGVIFVPTALVHTEPRLRWVLDDGNQLTRTGGLSGAPVFKPSRGRWAEEMGLQTPMATALEASHIRHNGR